MREVHCTHTHTHYVSGLYISTNVTCKLSHNIPYNRDNKHPCLFSKLAAQMGAYNHGMPIFMGNLY